MQLHDVPLSGNAYKVRLFCALTGIDVELVPVDMRAGAHKQPAYLSLNCKGQVPVLVDGDAAVFDSQAILVYLARKRGGGDWLPTDAVGLGKVMQWLSTAANEIANGCARSRGIVKFKQPFDLEAAQKLARHILGVLDGHLAGRDWLELGRPTVADVACYPYVALAPEGEVSLAELANVRAWCRRVEALPGYVPMPGLPLAA